MMKNSLNDRIFLKRVEHILTYNKLVNGKFYNYAFACHNSNSINYNTYKKRSEKNKLEFIITKENFIEITDKPCYICGKQNNQYHKNGIDRFDSKKGYLLDNCRPCCGECNYMKNNYDYNEMMRKFQCINNNIIKKEGFQEKNITENIILEVTPFIQEEKPIENTFIEVTPIIKEEVKNTYKEHIQILSIKKQDKQQDNKMIGISNKKTTEERRKWESERKKYKEKNYEKDMEMKNIKRCVLKKLRKKEERKKRLKLKYNLYRL
jgi:hypothetical protein